jgi:hypothetical protein
MAARSAICESANWSRLQQRSGAMPSSTETSLRQQLWKAVLLYRQLAQHLLLQKILDYVHRRRMPKVGLFKISELRRAARMSAGKRRFPHKVLAPYYGHTPTISCAVGV